MEDIAEGLVEEKGKKKKATAEDKLKILMEEQYERIEQMMEEKFKKLDKLIDEKLDHSQYRQYNSLKAELRRWYTGYYNY